MGLTGDEPEPASHRDGEAYVPGFGGLLEVKSPITPPVAAFVANNYYYVYLYNSGTTDAPVAAVELVTHSTAPDTRPTVYRGTARIKGTDNSRRYLFTVETNAEATPRMMNFRWQDGRTLFLETATRIMAGGTATAVTPVSFSSALPPHIRNAITLIDNNAPSPYLQVLSLNDAGLIPG